MEEKKKKPNGHADVMSQRYYIIYFTILSLARPHHHPYHPCTYAIIPIRILPHHTPSPLPLVRSRESRSKCDTPRNNRVPKIIRKVSETSCDESPPFPPL